VSFSDEFIEVAVAPSRYHCILLTVVHLLALAALPLSGMEPWLVAALGLAVAASLAWSLRRYGLLKDPRSVIRLVWRDGHWSLGLASGDVVAASLDSNLVVLSWLVVLHFRDERGNRYPVTLFPDSTAPDGLRRLRVMMKYGGGGKSGQ